MSRDLVLGLIGIVLFLVLLAPTERALLNLTRRHLDRRRRVIRSIVFLAGMAAWAYLTYQPLYRLSRVWWFVGFLVVAGLWKLVVDVLIFGAPDRPGSAAPGS